MTSIAISLRDAQRYISVNRRSVIATHGLDGKWNRSEHFALNISANVTADSDAFAYPYLEEDEGIYKPLAYLCITLDILVKSTDTQSEVRYRSFELVLSYIIMQ